MEYPDRGSLVRGTAVVTVRAIFLDIGQVLVGLDWQRVMRQINPWTTLSFDEIARRVNGNPDFDLYESGKMSTADFFRRVSNLLELKIHTINRSCRSIVAAGL